MKDYRSKLSAAQRVNPNSRQRRQMRRWGLLGPPPPLTVYHVGYRELIDCERRRR